VDTTLQALVMGIVQGLTEFLPVSSSGHLIIVPALLGWTDPFINSLEFSVMLHIGTLVALLIFFRSDWLRLVPAGLAALRDRSFRDRSGRDDPDRRLAWLIAAATIPAIVAGVLFNDIIENNIRQIGLVALMLVVGGAILWLAEHNGPRTTALSELSLRAALGIGAAQAIALVPGISRSGISIAAGLFAGLDRESAARFSFLMATPVTALAAAYEARKLVTGEGGVAIAAVPLIVGMVASLVAGLVAIRVLLRFVRSHSTDVFVAYRIVLAAVVVVAWLGVGR
jgi:undecaprenyl-diphosphatase